LSAGLRTERKARERHRNRDALLQDKIRTEQEKENKEKGDIDQCDKDKPREIEVCCSAEFHDQGHLFMSFRAKSRNL
jgi:hypothetical protein